ncbi:MAG TPA: 2-hydroxychromene-2-carboxylate isomerase [Caulobacteraceae bacterium]|nr:2-hydroxychromene-2-carboxylate isomerase [Caulobacteraceae bacterium]
MAALEFYFDFRSPYAYLAQSQLHGLGVEVLYRPFEILGLMDRVGNVPTSISCKAKNRYLSADLSRWVAIYQVPLQRHPQAAEIDPRRLLRASLAADELGLAPQAVGAIFHAYWGSGAPLTSSTDVAAVLSAAGVSGPDVASRIDDPALDRALDVATERAIERGVFGAPTMFVGEDMFFGNDRLEFVRASLRRAA